MGGESCTVLRLRLMRKLAMSHIPTLPVPPQSPLPQPNLLDLPLLHLDVIRRLGCSCIKVDHLRI